MVGTRELRTHGKAAAYVQNTHVCRVEAAVVIDHSRVPPRKEVILNLRTGQPVDCETKRVNGVGIDQIGIAHGIRMRMVTHTDRARSQKILRQRQAIGLKDGAVEETTEDRVLRAL